MTHYKSMLAIAITSAMMLAGCGDNGSKPAEKPATPEKSAATTSAPTASQSKDQVKLAAVQELVKGNGAEPASLDPEKTEGVPEANIQRDLFEGLVTTDATGKIRPGVAESWETKDNKVFTFHLRKTAKWSNGDPVTANDFVYSFRRLADPKTASPYAYFLDSGSVLNAGAIMAGKAPVDSLGVKAIDDYTLEITLANPLSYFVDMVAHTSLDPVPEKVIAKFGEKWTRPENIVTNGAYTVKEWVVNERLVLERNKQYWDNAHTTINKVTYLPIESQTADVNRYMAGEIDLTYNELPLDQFKHLKAEHPDEVKVVGYVGSYFYEFNFNHKPFDDVRVRKALSYAIDRNIIANAVVARGEKPSYYMTPEIAQGFPTQVKTEWSTWTQEKRNDEAKKLLKEAGYDESHPLKFELLYNTNEVHKKIAIAVASMWKKTLGVDVSLINQEWKSYLASEQQGNFDVSRNGWIADYNETASMVGLMESTNASNYGKYNNPAYDKLMQDSRMAPDVATRKKLYGEAEELLAKDMPIAPIYQYVSGRLVKPYVGGYPNNPLDNLYTKDMYIIAH
nr:ABC transporter substrate-binding protein [uncultured Tolumonas sp.]